MKTNILSAIRLTLVCLVFFSWIYTIIIWSIAKLAPNGGKGEIILQNGKTYYGNIAQHFSDDKYFSSRPSAVGYNAAGSGGSNKGPTNPDYLKEVQGRIDTFLVHNPDIDKSEIPSDLMTASGAGLDPHISVQAANVQVKRIAKIRGIAAANLQQLIISNTEAPLLGLFGTEKINVLKLNLALDKLNEYSLLNNKKMNKITKSILGLTILIGQTMNANYTFAQQKGEPFEGIDQSWQNGNDRRDSSVFKNMKYFTPSILMDVNYTHSFNNPNDNTVVGSTALARNNEVQLSALHVGGDFNYRNARARFMTQFGTRSIVVPRNDYSPYRGQYQLANVYRYLSEAYAGYHFNKWYGINVDAGLFMSYIGLNSYYQPENWEYQASYTSDNTPWFFSGVRVQIHPNKNWKIEPWIINGWQSYGKFNKMPGIGGNITYMSSNSNVKALTNNYYGTDAGGLPERKRFHSDNSLLVRYFNKPESKGISRMAFSLTGDIGSEKGGGVNGFKDGDSTKGPAQYFASAMFYNRIWFGKNKFAWTIGGGIMKNPGRYLVLYPTGQASPLPNPNNPSQTEGAYPFSASPGDQFNGWDCSTNFDWMPNQSITFRIEFVHRESSVPYFAGKGGVTSPTGYSWTTLPQDWRPDLVKSEDRVLAAILFRL